MAKKEEIIFQPRQKFNYAADEKIFYDTIIVGAGVVGFAAGMYAGRLGLKTLIIGELRGGTITLTNVVENYPGFVSLSGPKLAELVEAHARDYDIDVLNGRVEKIIIHEENKKMHFSVFSSGKTFKAKTIIFATGTRVRKLGVRGEKELENKGVSYCALCDAPLFKNKTVGVVGGSDSAVKEALLLTEYAKKVYIIYRGERIHPEPINMNRVEKKIKIGKIEIINNKNIVEIRGNKFVEAVVMDKSHNGKKELKLDGLFVAIGHIPLSDLAISIGVGVNEKGEIIINRNAETNVKGVYAAGDVVDTEFKQAITGVAEGVAAVYHAYEYINKGEFVLPCDDDG